MFYGVPNDHKPFCARLDLKYVQGGATGSGGGVADRGGAADGRDEGATGGGGES